MIGFDVKTSVLLLTIDDIWNQNGSHGVDLWLNLSLVLDLMCVDIWSHNGR